MAFGKKKDEASETPARGTADAAPAADEIGGLFAPPEPAPEAELAAAAPEAADEPAVEPAPAAPATDALLGMFQEAEGEGDDRSIMLDLAGDVELSDLLEDLHTAAAALGVRTSIDQ